MSEGIYSKGKELLVKPVEQLKKEELEKETLIKKAVEVMDAMGKLEPELQTLAKAIPERKAKIEELQAFVRVLNQQNLYLDGLEADVLSQLRKLFIEKMGIMPDKVSAE